MRADKITKGIRLITVKTDMTLSSLNGHLEVGSGNLDIVGAPGNLSVRTRDTEISLENPGEQSEHRQPQCGGKCAVFLSS